MDSAPLPSDEEQKVICEMIGRFDAPAFIRRAKRVEESYQQLLTNLAQRRSELLALVGLRLGQLRVLTGNWSALPAWVRDPAERGALVDLHDALQPALRLPPEPTEHPRILRQAINELIEAMAMFNRRWQRALTEVDLERLNSERDGYNRYYLLEKECALGSARTARSSFRPLAPITIQQLSELFAPLLIPACAAECRK
jgi:hypothetical protein